MEIRYIIEIWADNCQEQLARRDGVKLEGADVLKKLQMDGNQTLKYGLLHGKLLGSDGMSRDLGWHLTRSDRFGITFVGAEITMEQVRLTWTCDTTGIAVLRRSTLSWRLIHDLNAGIHPPERPFIQDNES
ncbi:uncharacterized protein LACBIDRAFT_330306 [Laccaria bicolor S238N-H82]|uniref:Predicted protein n=1 Tax=Laccaria bicolor (strain S238N-H82 / ATCC MYA-4686) TaxID=486041 RepID=B0DKV7_LACBS|nr:uncharacterized protein LACBIDRAFT_330306 [Laccaria bicolor S238N-H82]EDR04714.1 predicted protein [Laccaria bicolor S238N-H82]|eukprot:XP_001884538.1 predicted protein [Laccaria bicolor S238N-H82]